MAVVIVLLVLVALAAAGLLVVRGLGLDPDWLAVIRHALGGGTLSRPAACSRSSATGCVWGAEQALPCKAFCSAR